jgi:plasmid stabilization system protein ParE
MIFNIIWSPKAKETYYNIIYYLIENWTKKEIQNFIHRTEIVLDHVGQNYLLYPYSKKGNAYRAVINRQVSLYYRTKGSNIELLIFWDNRLNPKKLVKNIT